MKLRALFLLWLALAPASLRAAEPLNVVLIVADDLGAHDLGVTGSKFHLTPRLDRLAEGGMRFTQAYSAAPICSPSRAAILTGKAPARLKLTDWIAGHPRPTAKLRTPDWVKQLPLEEVTLAERLKERGYATAHIGKWHLGGEGFGPQAQGFDINLGGDHRGQPPSYFSPYSLPNLPDGPAGESLTAREAAEAVKFLRAHRERRFFLHYYPHAVHTPLQARPEDVATFRERAARTGGAQTNATYAAMLQDLDRAVGEVLEALDELGLAERTLVIFTSDNGGLVSENGPTSNAPLRAGKGGPYEGGSRVPLFVRWPEVTRTGQQSAEPVIGMDLAATVLAAAGIEVTGALVPDGLNLEPLLRDPAARLSREALFWHYPHYHPGGATPFASARTRTEKVIQYYESGRHELFDLAADPGETKDLAAERPERVMALTRLLFAWQGSVGAQWPMSNPDWDMTPLQAPAEGPISLHSREAFVHGTVLRYEPQPFKNTLGWWARPEDWAEWRFELPRGGKYAVEIVYGCGNGSGGSEVEFKVGEGRWVFTVQETGGFQSFVRRTLGEVQLAAGSQQFTVRPQRKPGGAVMDLQEVLLRPLP